MEQTSGRRLAYKVNVSAIEPVGIGDRLEVARVHGWRIVVQKGQFHAGDTALYFEIDSALPYWDQRFEFLRERCGKRFKIGTDVVDECIRIRTMKLRGVLSQGLLMPVDDFCEVRTIPLWEDCTDVLHVRHYDDIVAAYMEQTGRLRFGDQMGLFPTFCPKTDEERIQNLDDAVIEKELHRELEATVKADGTSMSVGCVHDQDFGYGGFFVCSRNYMLKRGDSTYWQMVDRLGLEEKLRAWCVKHNREIVIQGELVGPGINGNRDKWGEPHFLVFRVWDDRAWMGQKDRYALCRELGLEHVPVEDEKVRLSSFGRTPQEIRDRVLLYAEGKTPRGNEREGLVFKSANGRFSFKAVSNRYLLNKEV